MTNEEAVAKLEALDGNDPESAHIEADNVLLAMVPEEVRAAYDRATDKIWLLVCLSSIVAFIEARLDEREKRARQFMFWNTKVGVRQKAEVAKDRAILALHRPESDGEHRSWCAADGREFPCQTVRLLAAIDADHADYDASWKPVAT